jgi:hypothetical protein
VEFLAAVDGRWSSVEVLAEGDRRWSTVEFWLKLRGANKIRVTPARTSTANHCPSTSAKTSTADHLLLAQAQTSTDSYLRIYWLVLTVAKVDRQGRL